jgi:four helix bundle protein
MSQPHLNLVAWQRADDLCVAIHRLARDLPRDERFELASQLRRAAYSIPANIAEGYAYPATSMRLKHLRISIGSLAEVGYGVHLATRLGYLTASREQELDEMIRRTAAPLHGLVAHLNGEQASRNAGVGRGGLVGRVGRVGAGGRGRG